MRTAETWWYLPSQMARFNIHSRTPISGLFSPWPFGRLAVWTCTCTPRCIWMSVESATQRTRPTRHATCGISCFLMDKLALPAQALGKVPVSSLSISILSIHASQTLLNELVIKWYIPGNRGAPESRKVNFQRSTHGTPGWYPTSPRPGFSAAITSVSKSWLKAVRILA